MNKVTVKHHLAPRAFTASILIGWRGPWHYDCGLVPSFCAANADTLRVIAATAANDPFTTVLLKVSHLVVGAAQRENTGCSSPGFDQHGVTQMLESNRAFASDVSTATSYTFAFSMRIGWSSLSQGRRFAIPRWLSRGT